MRERMVQAYEIMGSQGEGIVFPKKRWITQCTFFHLIDAFQGPQDPRLVYVRAFILRDGATYHAAFAPLFDADGIPDLQSGVAGDFSIVLRDAGGLVLATYPFKPSWKSADSGKAHRFLSVAYGVPYIDGTQSVELDAPGGKIASVSRSATVPAVAVTTPADGALVSTKQRLHVQWTATGDPAKKLLSSVFYSPDEGKTWLDCVFEQKGMSTNLRLSPRARAHWIKVVVPDGTRSAESIVKVHF